MIRKLVALDLEMNQPSGKIIQIGVAVGYLDTHVAGEKLSVIVDPGEPISQFITDLTGITQRQVDEEGIPLVDAYAKMCEFVWKHEPFINPLTWGGADTEVLKNEVWAIKNTILENGTDFNVAGNWPFGRRWIDAKTVYVTWRFANDEKIQGGLARAMTKLDLAFLGRKHDAADDAYNTLRIYFELLKVMKDA